MTDNHWYPHYIGDYIKDTSHISLVQHGGYRVLLDHYYSTKQPLPANAEQLHRICRAFAEEERMAVNFVLREFFELLKDGYHNKRADDEIEKRMAISKMRSKAAKVKHKKTSARAEQVQATCPENAHALAPTTTATATTTARSTTKSTGSGTKAPSPPLPAIPEWVPMPEWESFVKFRKKIKHPLTDEAIPLAFQELEKLRGEGHDPAAVLNQSILRGWRGLFPIKNDQQPKGHQHGTHTGFAKQDYYFDCRSCSFPD